MNVVTANENKQMIDRLNIEIMMRIDGAYTVRELLSRFVNLYFNKMIIDITSIKDYQNINTMRELAKAWYEQQLFMHKGKDGKDYVSFEETRYADENYVEQENPTLSSRRR